MDGDRQDNTVTTAAAGSQQTVLNIEMPKETPWKHPAVYIAILALIVALGGEWRRWIALDASNQKQHDYYEEINVWETDAFNRSKDVDTTLKARLGWDTDKMFGKLNPPPVPKEN